MEDGYELYIKSLESEQEIIEEEIYSISDEIQKYFSMSTTEYETLSSEEKSKYKEKLIKLKKDSKRKEKLSIMLSSIFDKRFIANVIERNNEKISLENYEDICDNIILLFTKSTLI